MRLSNKEIETIKNIVNSYLPSTIYVFGSRLEDNKKGGDLDLFLIPKEYLKNIDEKIGLIRIILEEKLMLKVDIVIAKNKNRAIEKEALKGVKL